jgi:diguanylate cyclase (GGDEF)-like protein
MATSGSNRDTGKTDNWQDLGRAARHGRHFAQTRAQILHRRIDVIARILGLAIPAWIVMDQILVPAELFQAIALGRIAAGVGLIWLALPSNHPYSLGYAQARLIALILVLTVVQQFWNGLIVHHGYGGAVAGYHFFPFMIVGMLAIFPLTLAEIGAYSGGLLAIQAAAQNRLGIGAGVEAFNTLWLMAVLALIAGFAAVNQLGMLLAMYRQATRDPLTGLSNRRQSLEQLAGDLELCRQEGHPLTVLMFDLDHFKKLNDTHGHAAGDVVLKTFADILRQRARSGLDLIGRHGGEEFLMVLPGLDSAAAMALAEVIRADCRAAKVMTPEGERLAVTASIGIAQAQPEDALDGLLQRADDALYQSKREGRDRATVAPVGEAPAA